jgi:hypothetical protein
MTPPASPENFNVRAWLESFGFGQYASAFEANHVSRLMLGRLTSEQLREIGVESLGHRQIILAAIQVLGDEGLPPELAAPKVAQIDPGVTAAPPVAQAVPVPSGFSKPSLDYAVSGVPPLPSAPGVPARAPVPAAVRRPAAATEARPVPEVAAVVAEAAAVPSVAGHEGGGREAEERAAHPVVQLSMWARFLRFYRNASGGSLLLSIGLHAIILFIGTWLVVSSIVEERKISFGGGAEGPRSDVQHKVQMKRKTTTAAPAPAKRITTTSNLARVALPDMPDMPTSMGPTISGAMGSGGFGAGGGLGGGGGGGGGGSGRGVGSGFSNINFFGLRSPTGDGMQGTFFDFKMDQSKKPTNANRGRGNYIEILQAFKDKGWDGRKPEHYKSPTKLMTKFFFFPGIHDSMAGPAFQSEDSGAGLWVAHYKGNFRASVPGRYRFVGWGDNVLGVKVGNDIVLDASDWGVFKEPREHVGAIRRLGAKSNNPVFAGKWMDLTSVDKPIEVVLGDQGGIFCAGLMIQKQGQELKFDPNGMPQLPLFIMAPLTPPEKELLKALPADLLKGPVFPAKVGAGSRWGI